jgi:iron-sulfur cluster repair protein YtfE (RIC family)
MGYRQGRDIFRCYAAYEEERQEEEQEEQLEISAFVPLILHTYHASRKDALRLYQFSFER